LLAFLFIIENTAQIALILSGTLLKSLTFGSEHIQEAFLTVDLDQQNPSVQNGFDK